MKKMRVVTVLIMWVFFLMLPSVGGAEPISWTSEDYTAYVYLQSANESSTSGGFGFAQQSLFSYARSYIQLIDPSDYTIRMRHELGGPAPDAYVAWGTFLGTYTADMPTLQFLYDYSLSAPTRTTCCGEDTIQLTVDDSTTGQILFDSSLFDPADTYSTGNVISINTTPGNEINVSLSFETAGYKPSNISNMNISHLVYSMQSAPVVPEPISSLLFVTGGTLLTARYYKSRKKLRR